MEVKNCDGICGIDVMNGLDVKHKDVSSEVAHLFCDYFANALCGLTCRLNCAAVLLGLAGGKAVEVEGKEVFNPELNLSGIRLGECCSGVNEEDRFLMLELLLMFRQIL
uniref:Uncharacterized protein n=1 Tax=Ditylenchus dipsaci TaxID=166011 RepID=A0A915E4V0_9BILA